MANTESTEAILKELHQIRNLLVSSLIVSGVEAKTLAKILGYRQASSITNEIPTHTLKKTVPLFRLNDAQTKASSKKRRRRQ